MLFNSFDFLIFFPIVCILYYVINYRFRYLFLLAASYYFYMCWNPKYALLMLASTVITYLSGIFIHYADGLPDEGRRKMLKKCFLVLSFSLNLGILFFFKYFNFAVDSLNRVLSGIQLKTVNAGFDVILPVGISFYTFQALSYTVDVYRGDIYREKNFFKYALFVSFFPQLVAGPIERSKNLLRQISVRHSFDVKRVQYGLTLMLFGLFQKMVISDNAALIVNQVYDNHSKYGSVELIFATVLFAFQIYCDFGGYTNIAIGAAKVMGFELMENFNTPYLADSVTDFWRRWHISLTSWFRDYLYIPLGGNRKGRIRKYINIMAVFLTSGLWHGASWHYVVWGGINGIYQIAEDLLKPVYNRLCRLFDVDKRTFSHRFAKAVIAFVLVDISWIFFRADGVGQALAIIKGICTRWDFTVLLNNGLLTLGMDRQQSVILVVSLFVLLFTDICRYLKVDLIGQLCRQEIWFQYGVYLLFIFAILIFGSYGPGFDASQFIYFQF
ncbi:MAG: MBOAT family protein [Lachnospiraceae bacterium]|nr:MBOAT family protein [Lachnospiraceae bacterium]